MEELYVDETPQTNFLHRVKGFIEWALALTVTDAERFRADTLGAEFLHISFKAFSALFLGFLLGLPPLQTKRN